METAAKKLNKKLKIRIQVNGFENLCRLVAENVGIGILPKSAVGYYEKHNPIRSIQIESSWAKRHLMICIRDFESLSLFTKTLVERLSEDSQKIEAL